jgi:prepilin-type N-terminal cleavage/methylation domain-containing protein
MEMKSASRKLASSGKSNLPDRVRLGVQLILFYFYKNLMPKMMVTRRWTLDAKRWSGFTLIELLVAVVVLAILGVVGTDLFSSVMKGANKANVITEVKQNGQLAMEIIERNIRQATKAETPNTPTLILTTPSGIVTFEFLTECKLPCTPASNGQITMNTNPITSTDTKTGVSVELASFVINEPPVSNPSAPKTVTVTLRLQQGVSAPTRKDFRADVTLTTTVSLRSY